MPFLSVIARMLSTGARTFGLFLLMVGLLIIPGRVTAQDQDEEEQQELPEIAPQEIEIRGELQLSFPSLQRQPLRGFATPVSLPEVPTAHAPYVDTYKQSLETLPDSLPTPQAVSSSLPVREKTTQGYLEMGVGRYLSRFAEGRLSLPLTTKQRLAFRIDYTGTDGFSPFPNADVTTPSDGLGGGVRFETRHDQVSFAADVHGRADQYTLYGGPAIQTAPNGVAPDRAGYSAGTTLHLRTQGALTTDATLGYHRIQFDSETDLSENPSTVSFLENRLSFTGTGQFEIGPRRTKIEVSFSRSTLGGDVPSSDAYTVDAGASVSFLESDRASVWGGAQFLGFESPADPALPTTPTASGQFFAPRGRAELALDQSVTLFAENDPGLADGALDDIYEENPYAGYTPSIRPTVMTTNARAGATLSVGGLRIQTEAGYRYAPSFRYYREPLSIQNVPEVFVVRYESARILHAGGQIGLQGAAGVEASVRVSVRDGALVGDDTNIPYFSPLVSQAMLAYSFADQRGHIQTTGTIRSPRPTDRTGRNEVGTYVAFDVEGSYDVTSTMSAVLRIQNLSPDAPEMWAGYPHPPGSVMGGVRIRW